jgi:tetratricopeptide (TPR) repeat protein
MYMHIGPGIAAKKSTIFFLLLYIIILTAKNPTPAFAQTILGDDALAEYRRRNYNEAIAICRGELKVNPANMDSYVVMCWSLIAKENYEEAQLEALVARGRSRYDARVVEILGETSYHLGQNAQSLKYFQEYINLAPEGQRVDLAYYYIGEINIRLGRFRYADIALTTAVHYQSDNDLWWTRLAYAREQNGELTEAANAYQKALAINKNSGDARRGLDRVRARLRSN